jgi:hypothetical protein
MSRIIHVQEHPGATRGVVYAAVLAALSFLLWWWGSAITDPPAEAPMPAPATSALPARSASPPLAAPARPIVAPVVPTHATSPHPEAEDADIRERNRNVQIAQLTHSRPSLAEAFLREVQVSAGPRGGFVVQAVLPDSRHHKLGLQPGDVIYSLDTPRSSAVDDSSMIALMQQTEIEIEVYRNGSPLRLQHAYNVDTPDDEPRR